LIKKIKHKINTSGPAQYMVDRSKRTFVPGFRGIPLHDVIMFFFKQVKTIGMTERASAIAFNIVMAIPPAIIFLFTLIPFFPISHELEEGLYSIIRDVIPGEKNNSVLINFLQDFINNPRNGLLSLGFLLSIFFSSNAVMGIQRSFDKNYIGFRKRTEWQKRTSAIKITMVLYVLVVTSILLLIAQGEVLKLIVANETFRKIILNARWLVIVLLFFASISYIYRHAPAQDKKWPLINPGSILATLLMLLLTLAFSWWVSRFGTYNELYGSIGTVLILMALIFINSLVLLIGFELNVSINSLRRIADERKHSNTGGDVT
jgi:membrane protein